MGHLLSSVTCVCDGNPEESVSVSSDPNVSVAGDELSSDEFMSAEFVSASPSGTEGD